VTGRGIRGYSSEGKLRQCQLRIKKLRLFGERGADGGDCETAIGWTLLWRENVGDGRLIVLEAI
jgi:hypothetical protein